MTINWTRKALKQLLTIEKPDRKRIYDSVQTLEYWPNCQNIKALKNHKHPYRLRVGNYRVFFSIESSVEIIMIEEVKKRNERTY
jgi:mRNA-degrading endonuclease RelE of RelBE toxin-antitoxin system